MSRCHPPLSSRPSTFLSMARIPLWPEPVWPSHPGCEGHTGSGQSGIRAMDRKVDGRLDRGGWHLDMQVDHGCLKAGVTQQILDFTQLNPCFQQMGGVAMPEQMW